MDPAPRPLPSTQRDTWERDRPEREKERGERGEKEREKEKDRGRDRAEREREKDRDRGHEKERGEREKEEREKDKERGEREKEKEKDKGKVSLKDSLSTPDYFISGILTINDRFQHCFFDVKVRKQPIKNSSGESSSKKSFTVKLFTSDIPPVPCDPITKFKVEFALEKVKSDNENDTTRLTLAEAQFDGTLFSLSDGSVKRSNNFVTVSHNLADWHFMEQTYKEKEGEEKEKAEKSEKSEKGERSEKSEKEKSEKLTEGGQLILYFLSVRVPYSKVKKFSHLL